MEGVLPKYRQPLIIKGPRTSDDAITAAMDLEATQILDSNALVAGVNSNGQTDKFCETMCQGVSDLCQVMNKNHHDVADMCQNFGKDITMLTRNVDSFCKTVSKLAIDQIDHDPQQSGPSVAHHRISITPVRIKRATDCFWKSICLNSNHHFVLTARKSVTKMQLVGTEIVNLRIVGEDEVNGKTFGDLCNHRIIRMFKISLNLNPCLSHRNSWQSATKTVVSRVRAKADFLETGCLKMAVKTANWSNYRKLLNRSTLSLTNCNLLCNLCSLPNSNQKIRRLSSLLAKNASSKSWRNTIAMSWSNGSSRLICCREKEMKSSKSLKNRH